MKAYLAQSWVSGGNYLSDVAGLEADEERPLEELLARRFSSVSRPANGAVRMSTDFKILVHTTQPQLGASCIRVSGPAGLPTDMRRHRCRTMLRANLREFQANVE